MTDEAGVAPAPQRNAVLKLKSDGCQFAVLIAMMLLWYIGFGAFVGPMNQWTISRVCDQLGPVASGESCGERLDVKAASSQLFGLIFLSIGIPNALTISLFGELADAWGRQFSLVVSIIGSMGTAACYLVPSSWGNVTLLVLFALCNFTGGQFSLTGAMFAAVGDLASVAGLDVNDSGMLLGYLACALNVGLVIGPIIGGALLAYLPAWVLPAFVLVCYGVTLAITAVVYRETLVSVRAMPCAARLRCACCARVLRDTDPAARCWGASAAEEEKEQQAVSNGAREAEGGGGAADERDGAVVSDSACPACGVPYCDATLKLLLRINPIGGILELLMRAKSALVLIMMFVNFTSLVGQLVTMPFIILGELKLSPVYVGLWQATLWASVGVGNLFLIEPAMRFLGSKRAVMLSVVFSAVCLPLHAIASKEKPWAVLVIAALNVFSYAFDVIGRNYVLQIVDQSKLGLANAGYVTTQTVAQIVGPLVAGAMYVALPLWCMHLAGALASILSVGFMFFVPFEPAESMPDPCCCRTPERRCYRLCCRCCHRWWFASDVGAEGADRAKTAAVATAAIVGSGGVGLVAYLILQLV